MKKWDIVKSTVAYENEYFRIEEEAFLLSSGKTGKYYMLKKPDFVAVVPVEDDCIHMIEMRRYTLRKKIWELGKKRESSPKR